MQKGREEKKQQGGGQATSRSPRVGVGMQGDVEDQKEDIHNEDSDTDEEEYNMMIAGLSEVVSCPPFVFFSFLFSHAD
jgi:hypothetical protein